MKKSLLILLILVLIGVGAIVFYLYNKPHRNVEEEKATISLNSSQLFNDYTENEKKADSIYLNKVVRISGVVSEMDQDQKGEKVLIFKEDDIFGVLCSLDETDPENRKKVESLRVGDSVVLKGIVTGFAEDVKLNKCVLLD